MYDFCLLIVLFILYLYWPGRSSHFLFSLDVYTLASRLFICFHSFEECRDWPWLEIDEWVRYWQLPGAYMACDPHTASNPCADLASKSIALFLQVALVGNF